MADLKDEICVYLFDDDEDIYDGLFYICSRLLSKKTVALPSLASALSNKVKRGLWSPEEDEKLMHHIHNSGHGSWSSIPKIAGLERCGKSCRLRWINYLRPDLKRGSFSEQEERIIIDVHKVLGNRWAQIAKQMPGRTDNEVKNFWNSCIKKKLISQGLDPNTHNRIIPAPSDTKYSHGSSSLDESSSSTFPTHIYQNPNMVWTDHFQEQYRRGSQPSIENSEFPIIPSLSHHYYEYYPSELDIIIENCRKWGTGGSSDSNTAEPRKMEDMQMKPEPEEESYELQTEKGSSTGLNYNGRLTNMDATTLGGCNLLDFDFVESTLVPCEMDYHQKANSMDQLAWHCN